MGEVSQKKVGTQIKEGQLDDIKKMAAESEYKVLQLKVKAEKVAREKAEKTRAMKEGYAKGKAVTDEKTLKMGIAAKKVARIKRVVAEKQAKADKMQRQEQEQEKKAKQSERKIKSVKAAVREHRRKFVVKRMQKLNNERIAEYKHADDIAKGIGREVRALQKQQLDLKNQVKKEKNQHKRGLLENNLEGVETKLENAETRFDQAREKLQQVGEQQKVAKKKMEEAKMNCKACGELAIREKHSEDLVVARAKALAFAKAQIPKGAIVIKSSRNVG